METDAMIVILIFVAAIVAAWFVTFIVAIQNAETIDPNKPFMKGDEGYPE